MIHTARLSVPKVTLIIMNTLNFQKNMDIRIGQVYITQKACVPNYFGVKQCCFSQSVWICYVHVNTLFTQAEISGSTGKLHCLGKHVLCMKCCIAKVSLYNNLLLEWNANINKLMCMMNFYVTLKDIKNIVDR